MSSDHYTRLLRASFIGLILVPSQHAQLSLVFSQPLEIIVFTQNEARDANKGKREGEGLVKWLRG